MNDIGAFIAGVRRALFTSTAAILAHAFFFPLFRRA
jgi:hypothetical protein